MNFYSVSTKAMASVMHTLPRSTIAFVGRTQEMTVLLRSVANAATTGNVIAIHAIDGMAGIGKTALAVHAGHVFADRFPDGQMFLRLHGHTPGKTPVSTMDALVSLLIATGLSPEDIPTNIDARAALWRNQLAGKRVLLILDDATDHNQVEPLLPGTRECLVLITSRRRLTALHDAVTLPLDVLSPEQASGLFTSLVGRQFSPAETVAVRQLVELCGRLPLAISLLAGRLKHRPAWRVEDLTRRVVDALDRLAEFRADGSEVAAAFDLSYEHLPMEQQKLFQLLGLHPGADFDAYSAAALSNTPLADASGSLDALYDDHLLNELVRGRYQMHDLIREYSRMMASHCPAPQREAAMRRLLNYFMYTASAANRYIGQNSRPRRLKSVRRPAEVPEIADQAAAIAWFEAERSSLLACIDLASVQQQHKCIVILASALAGYLRHSGPWQQGIEVHQLAIAAAIAIQDRAAEAMALADLGVLQFLVGQPDAADVALSKSIVICREISEQPTLARALTQLGTLRRLTGEYAQARDAQMEGLAIHRRLRDKVGQAYALTELGTVRPMLGDYPGAISALTQALNISRQLEDWLAEAYSLNELGTVFHLIGDYAGAAQALSEALRKSRELRDRFAEAYALNELGMVQMLTGDYEAAQESSRDALEIYRDLGSKAGEADALSYLGALWAITKEYPRSVDGLKGALAIYGELKDRGSQARTLTRLGHTQYLMGNPADAASTLAQAESIFESLGDLRGRAEATNNEAQVLQGSGEPRRARSRYEDALRLARESGSPLEEARALEGVGQCALALGEVAEGMALLQRALVTYQRIGSPRAAPVAAVLGETQGE
jgi:tetratricopeptide (TPR) repeat protein